MMMAILGVFLYNRAKQLDRAQPQLPYTRQHTLPAEPSMLELNNLETNDVMFRYVFVWNRTSKATGLEKTK